MASARAFRVAGDEGVLVDVDNARVSTAGTVPHLFPYVAEARLVLTRSVDTVAVSKGGNILVNPDFWRQVMFEGMSSKEAIILHEVLHRALAHVERGVGKDHVLWNLATDAFVNKIIKQIYGEQNFVVRQGVTIERLREVVAEAYPSVTLEKMYEMNEDELYHLLEKATRVSFSVQRALGDMYGNKWDGGGELGVDDELAEAGKVGELEPIVRGAGEAGEPLESRVERVRSVLVSIETEIYSRLAGVTPGLVERLVRSLRPRRSVGWRFLLADVLRRESGRTVVQTWKRPSRRYADVPGVKRVGPKRLKVLFLIDVSGSIPESELEKFVEESIGATVDSGIDPDSVYIVTWDVGVRDVVKMRDVLARRALSTSGGGGTVIDGALEYAVMERPDVLVVFTDGVISTTQRTRALAESARRVARKAIFVYTVMEAPEFSGWITVRYGK